MNIIINSIVLILILPIVLSCWGDPPCWWGNKPPRTKKPRLNALQRNQKYAWGGFDIPPELVKKWQKWLDDYNADRHREEDEDDEAYRQFRGDGSGWPYEWGGIGGGFAGSPPVAPPPWAYETIDVGLPGFCYMAPDNGTCRKIQDRWAFNAHLGECVEFDFTGCGGNQNNFKTKASCEKRCKYQVAEGCDLNTDISLEFDTIVDESRRRAAARKCGSSVP